MMHGLLHGTSEMDYGAELRRAAMNATTTSRRGFWLIGVAGGAALAFVILLATRPGAIGLSASGITDARQALEQTQRLASSGLPADRLYPMLLLLIAHVTNDVSLAARFLSGLAAVLSLFLAYQLCHSLADPERGGEQSCFALLALAMSPAFFLAGAGGGTEMVHLMLLLGALLSIERALGGREPAVSMALAGLLVAVSLLMRPISLVVPLAVGLWLWRSRPFGSELPNANLRPGLAFAGAFAIGAAPQLIFSLTQPSSTPSWGLPELGILAERLVANPLNVLIAAGQSLVAYVAADDFERFSAVAGSWQVGEWGSLPGAIIALAPSILKLIGLIGLASLCWLERFETGLERARLPGLMLVLVVASGSLGLIGERSLLFVQVLLLLFAFAALPSMIPGAMSGVLGLGLVGMMLFYQLGIGYSARLAPSFRAADLVSAELQAAGASPTDVMSANWAYYNTRSPWRERYQHVPIYVDSVESLIVEMRRLGATYVVFDRQVGAEQWPRLANLMETERPRPGLRALHAPIRTDESPPNSIAIYKLD